MKNLTVLMVVVIVAVVTAKEVQIGKVGVDFGGYGELHLNKVVPEEGTSMPAKFDFHRFVVMMGLQFNQQWSFASEIELEHNKVENVPGGKNSGYLILEQAYLQFEPATTIAIRAGVMLQPMGLINEYHEPSTFNTVERPIYHKYIIPTTWFGTGLAIGGNIVNNALRYDVLVTEGLNDRNFGKNGIRSGRQKGYKASLENILGTVRLDYIGLPGLKVGGSFALNENIFDEYEDVEDLHIYDRTTISEVHVQYNGNGFRSSAEFATIAYSAIEGRGGDLENTQGFTAELGYDIARIFNAKKAALYPYSRFTQMNHTGKLSDDGAYSRVEGGLAFHPIKPISVKFNIGTQFYEGDDNDITTIDVGVGYDF
jgi:hypothetical protein